MMEWILIFVDRVGWTLMVPVEGYYMHAVDKLWKMLAWLGRPHATRADLRIDLLWRATDLMLPEDTWMEGKIILQSLSVYITEDRAQSDSTGKTNWIKIKSKSKTIQEYIKISQRLQLQCFLQFFPDDKVYKLSSYCFPQHHLLNNISIRH
jgi:hypothetical protein